MGLQPSHTPPPHSNTHKHTFTSVARHRGRHGEITRLYMARDTGSTSDMGILFNSEEHYLGD